MGTEYALCFGEKKTIRARGQAKLPIPTSQNQHALG